MMAIDGQRVTGVWSADIQQARPSKSHPADCGVCIANALRRHPPQGELVHWNVLHCTRVRATMRGGGS